MQAAKPSDQQVNKSTQSTPYWCRGWFWRLAAVSSFSSSACNMFPVATPHEHQVPISRTVAMRGPADCTVFVLGSVADCRITGPRQGPTGLVLVKLTVHHDGRLETACHESRDRAYSYVSTPAKQLRHRMLTKVLGKSGFLRYIPSPTISLTSVYFLHYSSQSSESQSSRSHSFT